MALQSLGSVALVENLEGSERHLSLNCMLSLCLFQPRVEDSMMSQPAIMCDKVNNNNNNMVNILL